MEHCTVIGMGTIVCIAVSCCAVGMVTIQSHKQRVMMGILILGVLAAGSVLLGGYVGLPCSLLVIAAMERMLRYHRPFIGDSTVPLLVAILASGVFLYFIAHVLGTNLWLSPIPAETPELAQVLPLGALALGVILARIEQDVGP
jgi:hypothetical protein